jgi:hypothetical protein
METEAASANELLKQLIREQQEHSKKKKKKKEKNFEEEISTDLIFQTFQGWIESCAKNIKFPDLPPSNSLLDYERPVPTLVQLCLFHFIGTWKSTC